MFFRASVLKVYILAILVLAGCKDNTTEPGPSSTPSTITGTIVSSDFYTPIVGARIVDQGSQKGEATSDSLGNFTLSFGNLSSQYTTLIIITASGYYDTTRVISIDPGKTQSLSAIYMRRNSGQVIYSNPDAKKAAQIAFLGVSASDIYISGVGALENAVIEYEVRDSLGMPVAKLPRYGATFTVNFFPNTQVNDGTIPRVIPSSDSTDVNGRLRVSIVSGTEAGVVQVVALVTVDNAKVIRSSPVKISVHAGFADKNHFTLASHYYNFPGLEYAFYQYTMTVQVVDKYSNPVLPGTAVYFNTMHGAIGTGTSGATSVGVTDIDGFVSQTLWSGNPYPEFPSDTLPYGSGYSWVYARTLGDSAIWVKDSVLMLWTGHPIISNVTGPTTFAITNGGAAGPWTFTIADKFGHPMSPGTTIDVSGTGLLVDGDAVKLVMPDTFASGPGTTTFTVVASDVDPANINVPPTMSVLTLTINHPVYGVYKLVLATGSVQ